MSVVSYHVPVRISDEVLHTYAVVGTYDEIGRKLVARYRGLVTDVEFSIPAGTASERGILRELVERSGARLPEDRACRRYAAWL